MAVYRVTIYDVYGIPQEVASIDTSESGRADGGDIYVDSGGVYRINNGSLLCIFDYWNYAQYSTNNNKLLGLGTRQKQSMPDYETGTWIDLDMWDPYDSQGVNLYIVSADMIEGKYRILEGHQIDYSDFVGTWGSISSIQQQKGKEYQANFYMDNIQKAKMVIEYSESRNSYMIRGVTPSYDQRPLICEIDATTFKVTQAPYGTIWFNDEDNYINTILHSWIVSNFTDITTRFNLSIKTSDGNTTLASISSFIKGKNNTNTSSLKIYIKKTYIQIYDSLKVKTIYTHSLAQELAGVHDVSTDRSYEIDNIIEYKEEPWGDGGFYEIELRVLLGDYHGHYIIQKETILAIVNAIKAKTGRTEGIAVKDIYKLILDLPVTVYGKWKLHDTVSCKNPSTFEGNVHCGGINYKRMTIDNNTVTLYSDNITTVIYENGECLDNNYRTIDFGDTPQDTNAEFIKFLEANASTIQSSSSVGFITDEEIDDIIDSISL